MYSRHESCICLHGRLPCCQQQRQNGQGPHAPFAPALATSLSHSVNGTGPGQRSPHFAIVSAIFWVGWEYDRLRKQAGSCKVLSAQLQIVKQHSTVSFLFDFHPPNLPPYQPTVWDVKTLMLNMWCLVWHMISEHELVGTILYGMQAPRGLYHSAACTLWAKQLRQATSRCQMSIQYIIKCMATHRGSQHWWCMGDLELAAIQIMRTHISCCIASPCHAAVHLFLCNHCNIWCSRRSLRQTCDC